MRDRNRYPGPVRAMGSYHSLTPCASSPGTMVDMKRMTKIITHRPEEDDVHRGGGSGDHRRRAGALRKRKLQPMLNIEIGNLTLGSAACCQTKDSLDAVEFGQVNSYITGMKWVTPAGDLAEADGGHRRAAALSDASQLRARRHRLRGDVPRQAARDREVQLRDRAGGRSDHGAHQPGDRLEPVHGVLECR